MNSKIAMLSANDQKALDYFSQKAREILKDNLSDIYLFGSKARGDDTPDSDMDVLLAIKDPVEKYKIIDVLSDLIVDILLEYQVLISVFPAGIQEMQYKRERLLFRTIAKEGIRI